MVFTKSRFIFVPTTYLQWIFFTCDLLMVLPDSTVANLSVTQISYGCRLCAQSVSVFKLKDSW